MYHLNTYTTIAMFTFDLIADCDQGVCREFVGVILFAKREQLLI